MYVFSGVCDCCDGSDEASEVPCENTCDILRKLFRQRQEENLQTLRQGLQKKSTIMKQARQRLETLRSNANRAVDLLKEYEDLNKQLKEDSAKSIEQIEQELAVWSSAATKLVSDPLDEAQLVSLLAALTLLSTEEAVESMLLDLEEKYTRPGIILPQCPVHCIVGCASAEQVSWLQLHAQWDGFLSLMPLYLHSCCLSLPRFPGPEPDDSDALTLAMELSEAETISKEVNQGAQAVVIEGANY